MTKKNIEFLMSPRNISQSSFFIQLRSLVFNFTQKELAPKAAEIDKKNNFDELRVSTTFHRETISIKQKKIQVNFKP